MSLTKLKIANPVSMIKKADNDPTHRLIPAIFVIIGLISLIFLPNKDSYNLGFKTLSSIAKSTKQTSTQNLLPGNIHIGQLTGLSTKSENQWIAIVKITLLESDNKPAENIEVTGLWNAGPKGTSSCITDIFGSCLLTTGKIDNKQAKVTFTLQTINQAGSRYFSVYNKDNNQALNPIVILSKP